MYELGEGTANNQPDAENAAKYKAIAKDMVDNLKEQYSLQMNQ